MNIIVINLERAKERRKKMESQLNSLGLNAVILEAIDGEKLDNDEKNKYIYNPSGWRHAEKFMPGEIGCVLSTINAIKFAKENSWKNVIIMDDDIILSEDFEKGVNFIMKIIPSDWDHIFLGGHIYLTAVPIFQPSVIPVNFKISGSYCYILNESAYDKILHRLSLFELPVDDVIEKLTLYEKNLKSYIFFPFLAYPLQNYSYIWNENGNNNHPSIKYFKNKLWNL